MTDKEIWIRFEIAQRELTELIKQGKTTSKYWNPWIKHKETQSPKEQQHGITKSKKIRSKT